MTARILSLTLCITSCALAAQEAVSIDLVRDPEIAKLTAALTSNDWCARKRAAEALGQMGARARSVVPELAKALKDQDQEIREVTVVALRELGLAAKDALPALAEAMRDPGKLVKDTATAAYQEIWDLSRLTKDEMQRRIRKEASALTHENVDVRRAAAITLRRIGRPAAAAAPYLVQRVRHMDIPAAASKALVAIGPAAVPHVRELVASPNPSVAAYAVLTLGRLGPYAESTIRVLAKALGDGRNAQIEELGWPKEAPVRRYAVWALGKTGAKTVPLLLELLKARDQDIRLTATQALAEMGPQAKDAVPPLLEQARSEDRGVRVTCAALLGAIGTEDTIPTLISLLEDEDRTVRRRAALSLRETAPEAVAVIPALVKAVRDPDEWVRLYAVEALGRCGFRAKSATQALRRATKDKSEDVQKAAERALKAVGVDG